MTYYTIAYNARCRSGWSDERGNLFDDVIFLDSKEKIEALCENLNKRFGRGGSDFLTYYPEEIEEE